MATVTVDGTDVTVQELTGQPDGKSGARSRRTRRYHVRGTSDLATAETAVYRESPSYWDGLWRTGVNMEAQYTDSDYPSKSTWEARVTYEERKRSTHSDRPEQPDVQWQTRGDATGGTKNISTSYQTVGAWSADGSEPPDYGGAIGVTKDGIEGVDIHVPTPTWKDTFYPDTMTKSLLRSLVRLTGSVNANGFNGFDTGEVLYRGPSWSVQNPDVQGEPPEWTVELHFAVAENRSEISIGDITVDFNYGWDYLWVAYTEKEVDAPSGSDQTKITVKTPTYAYSERVYPFRSFAPIREVAARNRF